jgi:hypothetical protein
MRERAELHPTLSPSAQPREPVVADDLACHSCGYNLRGLSSDSRCPECGSAIAISARGDKLCFSDPRWIQKVRIGTVILAAAAVCGALTLLVVPILITRDSGWPLINTHLQGSMCFAAIFHLAGGWMLTATEPHRRQERHALVARWLVRLALCIVVAVLVLRLPQLRPFFPTRTLGSATRWLAFFAAVGAMFGVAGRMEQLATRMPDPWLANQAEFLKWAIVIFAGAGLLFVLLLSFSRGGGAVIGFLCFGILLWLGLLTISLICLGTLAALAIALRTEHREAIKLRNAPADLLSRR